MYIPPSADTTSDPNAKRFILLLGVPGSGKTWAAIKTAPNPIAALFEQAITDPRLIELNTPKLKFYKSEWCESAYKKKNPIDAFSEFLKTDAKKFTLDQTLVVDSLSSYCDFLGTYLWAKTPTPQGATEPDVRAYYGLMKDWFVDLFTLMSTLECNIILVAHITYRTDATGVIKNIAPMVEGATRDGMGRHFTDMIRQIAIEKKIGEKVTTEYKWQVKSSGDFTAKCRANIDTLYIPADFRELVKL